MKKLIALLACLSLSLHIVGCTSSDTKDETEIAAEEGAVDESALDGDLESVESVDDTAVADTANEGFLDEQLPEDALGESTAAADAAPAPAIEEPPALDTSAESMDSFAADSSTPTDSSGTPDGFSAPPPVDDSSSLAGVDPGSDSSFDSSSSMDTSSSTPDTSLDTSSSLADTSSSSSSSSPSYEEPAPAPVVASLKKIDETPRTVAGQLLNGVYVARPKDTWKSISTTVYGSANKVSDLKAANSWIKGQPKGGDKVYYNSPQRPTDNARVLTYYEDAGMVPEVYVAKDGDNLKKVSKELLGYDNAWKEVWATNSVDSKAELTAGTELRYWRSAPAPMVPPAMPDQAQDVAMNNPPPVQDMAPPPPMNDFPPPPPVNEMPPPPDMAMNEMPPPPDMAPPPDLPPPPPAEAVNPPPPPAMAQATGEEMPADQDTMMMLGGGAIIAAGLALLLVVRKRRQQRDMAAAFNDTHVGS